jgi:SAM-dependent methyltransferase
MRGVGRRRGSGPSDRRGGGIVLRARRRFDPKPFPRIRRGRLGDRLPRPAREAVGGGGFGAPLGDMVTTSTGGRGRRGSASRPSAMPCGMAMTSRMVDSPRTMSTAPEQPARQSLAKRVLPASVHRALCDWRDARRVCREFGIRSMPDGSLRERVHGHASVAGFVATGRRCAESLLREIERPGRGVPARSGGGLDVLDFGCGAGRTLLWMRRMRPAWSFFGSDIDGEAIDWCRRQFGDGRFETNDALPPLAFPDDRFDVVYAISVLTHLDEARGGAWLDELHRVVRPGGLVLASLHGEACVPPDPGDAVRREMDRRGFCFQPHRRWERWFPAWYGNAFHTREFVARTFTGSLELLAHVDRGMAGRQDLVVLRKPGASG